MRRLLLFVASAAALWLAACGSGGSPLPPLPPPTGNYSNASLNGTYAFVTSGQVASFSGGFPTQAPFVRTGSFVADGQGRILGGFDDVNLIINNGGVSLGGSPTSGAISGGSYTVNADGRGTMNLQVSSGGFAATINFGIVLTSTSDGLMMDETSLTNQNSTQASTGSGNFIKQDPNSFTSNASAISGTYVFDFSGLDSAQGAASIVGEFAANGAGVLTTGFEDSNDNGSLSNGSLVQGSFTADPANMSTFGRGLANIGGETFAFYIVNSTRIRMIDITPGSSMLTGDAVLQDNTIPTSASSINSGFAFIISGASLSFTNSGGLTRVGRFTSTAGTVSQVYVDTNNAGTPILTNVAGNAGSISQDPANPGIPGRWLLTITDQNNSTFTAVIYLSSAASGVIQETTFTALGAPDVADGSIAVQSGGPLSASNVTGTYAFNWSGLSAQQGSPSADQEEDCLGQATASNLSLSGAGDLYEFSIFTAVPDLALLSDSAIAIKGNGTTSDGNRSTMTIHLATNSPITFVVYFVSPQRAFFVNNSNYLGRVAAGVLKVQQ